MTKILKFMVILTTILLGTIIQPALGGSHNHVNSTIEFKPPLGPKLKVVFTCKWPFHHLNRYKIIPMQDFWTDDEKCIDVERHAQTKLLPMLKEQYTKGGNTRILGIPTQEWEMPTWKKLNEEHLVMISDLKTNEKLGNKVLFKQYMNEIGLGDFVPQKYNNISDAKYPCVIKLRPFSGTNSFGVHIVYNSTQLDFLITKYAIPEEPYLLEEAVISSDEIAASFVSYKGKLLKIDNCLGFNPGDTLAILDGSNRYMRTKVPCESLQNWESLSSAMSQLIAKSEFNGIGCINYKYTTTNNIKILEMNTRIGFGLSKNIAVLAEFIWLWWFEHTKVMKV